MSKLDPSLHLLYWLLRAQHLTKKGSSESGYAMVLVSVVTVMMFSLLAAYLTITNITKAATNAYAESNSNFYIAESGLNQRSNAIRQKFVNYATPDGISPGAVAGKIAGPENMAACIADNPANWGSGDFACQRVQPKYKQLAGAKMTQGANGNALTATDYSNNTSYTTYTFTSDRTTYADLVRKIPQVQPIPAGEAYAGLNAQEYRYTVYSTATSKQTQDLDAKSTTVLEMTFKNRVVPLFQFAAFYDGDLEMNSTSPMVINGRVHTNGNLYAQPTPVAKKKGADVATTRLLAPVTVAGSIYNRVDASSNKRFGDTEVLMSGDPTNPNAPANDYDYFPEYVPDRKTPFTPTEIAAFKGKVLDGDAGATELTIPQPDFLRKRGQDGSVGEYYGKADLRLEMVPKRAAGNVPFNFTAIKDGGVGGSCTGFDLSAGRQGNSLNCTALTEGQLRSLQQPVMVKVLTDEERTRFCTNPGGTALYNPTDGQALRALQVAIAAQNDPVTLTQLNSSLSNGTNTSIRDIATTLTTLTPSQTPVQIAAAKGGCFLPAPIQTLIGSGAANPNYFNWQSSYFDRREKRWIGMLQTNINSLTVWNRDGLYVDRDNSLTTNDLTTAAQNTAAFNGGSPSSTYDTNNLLFVRAAAKTTAPTGSFQKLGLGSADRTEGGLVFYATVSDDLDGNGTDDITVDPADSLRNYIEGKMKSSYGFAISGGDDLPGSLTVVSDRGLYVQGDYNNSGATPTVPISLARQPASLVGDTITILSNSCLDANARINCGITAGQNPATTTTVNAAFLSFTDISTGNINGNLNRRRNRNFGNLGSIGISTVTEYSGGLNNYMRMVEDWSNRTFNYTGSFVSLGEPQEFNGDYLAGGSGGYYNVPNRNFNYDINFNAFDRLPPLTPNVVYLQQETFKRSFK